MKDCEMCDDLADYWKTVDCFKDRFPPQSIIKDYRKLIECLETVSDKQVYDDGEYPFPYINVETKNGSETVYKYVVFVDYSMLLEWIGMFLFPNKENYKYINKTECVICGTDTCDVLNQFNRYRDKKIKNLLCCEHAKSLDQGCCYNCKKLLMEKNNK